MYDLFNLAVTISDVIYNIKENINHRQLAKTIALLDI